MQKKKLKVKKHKNPDEPLQANVVRKLDLWSRCSIEIVSKIRADHFCMAVNLKTTSRLVIIVARPIYAVGLAILLITKRKIHEMLLHERYNLSSRGIMLDSQWTLSGSGRTTKIVYILQTTYSFIYYTNDVTQAITAHL